MEANAVILFEFVLYLAGMLAIGVYFARQELSQADFHLGGRKMPGWILALSERSTGESAWLILGLTGFAYSKGLSAVWIAVGCVVGISFSWIFLAKKFRQEAEKYQSLTYTDYLAFKYPRQGPTIRWLASAIIIFFFILYVAAQFNGGGKTLQATFGIPETPGVIISSVIVILYSMGGGFLSVVWTDAIQAVLMIATFIVTPAFMLYLVNQKGVSVMGALAGAANPAMGSWTGGAVGFAAGVLIFNNLSWIFGYLGGQPQLSTRWMAMKNDEDVKTGMWVAIVWTLAAYIGAILIGLCAFALFGPGVVSDPEQILPHIMSKYMSPWLTGFLLVGAIAAIMSTASSQLLIVTSAISEDIIHKALRKEVTDKQLVLISRVTMCVTGLLGLLLSLYGPKKIYDIVGWAWAGIGCSFAPAILLSFWWKRMSGAGVIACMVSGLVATVIWMTTGLEEKITSRFMTFVIAGLFGIIVSILLPDPEKDQAATPS